MPPPRIGGRKQTCSIFRLDCGTTMFSRILRQQALRCRVGTSLQSPIVWSGPFCNTRSTKKLSLHTNSTTANSSDEQTAASGAKILDQIRTLRTQAQTLHIEDNGLREKLLEETQLLVREFELPWNVIQRFCFISVSLCSASAIT